MKKKFDRYEYFGDNEEIATTITAIVIGCLLSSFAINFFFIPNKLLSGGVGGTYWTASRYHALCY